MADICVGFRLWDLNDWREERYSFSQQFFISVTFVRSSISDTCVANQLIDLVDSGFFILLDFNNNSCYSRESFSIYGNRLK